MREMIHSSSQPSVLLYDHEIHSMGFTAVQDIGDRLFYGIFGENRYVRVLA